MVTTYNPPALNPFLEIVLVEHGEKGPEEGSGIRGPGLTELGREQARLVALRLKDVTFTSIYYSDQLRARQTAETIIEYHPEVPMTMTSDIREVHEFNYLPMSPEDETPELLERMKLERVRMDHFIKYILETYSLGHRVLVVAHGNLIRCLSAMFCQREPREATPFLVYHTSITRLEITEERFGVLALVNCVRHLKPEQITPKVY
jgi:broad specificity phosphatase PhoE